MLSGQPLDTSFDFAPCYEVLTKKILEQQPKIGVNQIQKLSQVKVFPNPTQNNWSVLSNMNCNFTVFNAQMQVVNQFGVLAGETFELNASDLPSGIYFLKNDSGSTLKIVKSSN